MDSRNRMWNQRNHGWRPVRLDEVLTACGYTKKYPIMLPLGVKTVSELAQARGPRECLQFLVRERAWINDRHLQLCRIPAPTFFEQKRAEWFVQQFREYGYDARLDRAGNVVAHREGERDGPYIAVTAHLDTVLAPRAPEEIGIHPDGRFFGPGVADNGAGLAALLALSRAMSVSPDIGGGDASLLFVANVGEEGEGNLSGMRYLCRQSPFGEKIKTFVVLDGPTTDHITCQALASRRFEVMLTGSGGHSWSDHGTGNPVHALSRAVTLFTDQQGARVPGEPRSTFNVGVIEGGSSVNSIPTSARAKIDLRSQSVPILDGMSSTLTACVERAIEIENERATGSRVAARIKEIGARPGGQLSEGSPLLSCLRAVDTHLGIKAHLDCASTDANIPLSLGIPAVSIGAGGQGGGAHTPFEWFHPEGRDLGLRRILLTLSLLLRGPA